MSNDSSKNKIKIFSKDKIKLPEFANSDFDSDEIQSSQETNVIRVPFGIRLSKKKRPEKNQNIATLILPITSFNSPTPPPNVA
tara:strand:- start:5967 stop:6215 length:249 start_codon:yes stop_codon:yes gene_type:complete